MSDAAYGVRASGKNGRYSTALPANLGAAASWDLEAAYEYGALIGRELRAQGFNMSLGGGVNLTREARNGRNFEYLGEDPILAGMLVGQLIKGTQDQHLIGDIKHYALNNQETGRNAVNVNADERSMRETDLLAFEIGIREGNPAGVMCSYNRVNGDYACDNKYLLTDVLKKEWKFPGFVLSDWGAAHSVAKASAAGMDHEQPNEYFYGEALKKAVEAGQVPMSEVDDHVHRIVRSMFATGVIDDPPQKSVVDVEGGFEISQRIAEHAMVLLKNEKKQLPLDASKIKSIALIGSHADLGMLSGGGSAQVDPSGGNVIMPPGKRNTVWGVPVWFPTSPMKAIQAKTKAKVTFDAGTDLNSAAALAKGADVAIVFASRWEIEGLDSESISLGDGQDELIGRVAAANPNTIVVLETGNPVSMPWIDNVNAILEAWYGGSKGADALANILFGDVNPSAKLPITFPKSEADLPHTSVTKEPPGTQPASNDPDAWKKRLEGLPAFQSVYDEKLKVGYKWYDAERKSVLFPFGYGLSYTTYSYANLKVAPGKAATVSFTVKNTGSRAGAEIAQVYASLPASAGEPPKRLVGWRKVKLNPGESKDVTVVVEPLFLSIFNVEQKGWQLVGGDYGFMVGGSSQSLPLKASVSLK
jgi:beta-glucosidase